MPGICFVEIFKALSYHELITGCVAAASSSIYIISCFVAFTLLLIYMSQLLTPNNHGGCSGRAHCSFWSWQPTGSSARFVPALLPYSRRICPVPRVLSSHLHSKPSTRQSPVPSSLQHQLGGSVPHCPQCHSCPQRHPQPSSALSHAYQKFPMLRGSCSAAAPCAGSGAPQLCYGYHLSRIPGVLESLKKKMEKKMTVS